MKPLAGHAGGMVSLSRRLPVGRAFAGFVRASADRGCPACYGVLHIWGNEHASWRGRPSLEQLVVCLHCNLRVTRILPIPTRSGLHDALVGLALLVFTSLRLPRGLRPTRPARVDEAR